MTAGHNTTEVDLTTHRTLQTAKSYLFLKNFKTFLRLVQKQKVHDILRPGNFYFKINDFFKIFSMTFMKVVKMML